VVKQHIRSARDFFIRHERRLASISLLIGFIVDSLTLRRIDLLSNQLILIWYLVVLGVGIALINIYQVSIRPPRWLERFYIYLPIIIQFAFGNLFSGFMVLYSRSTSIIASWPFLLFLFLLLVGNELFQPYYLRFRFQSALFFFALFSFFIVYVPLLTGTVGVLTFLCSAAIAVALFFLLLHLLAKKLPALVEENKQAITGIVASIVVVVSVFYATNVIPPIPLSLEDGGAYHRVERYSDGYIFTEEDSAPPHFLRRFFANPTLHIVPGQSVYVYSSVFAPRRFSDTTIVHDWQWFDETKGRWTRLSSIPFSISGGRDEGYRGYTLKGNVPEGHWRVDVETSGGQVIGRIKFNIEYVDQIPPLTLIAR
jgi:hypothetical protein